MEMSFKMIAGPEKDDTRENTPSEPTVQDMLWEAVKSGNAAGIDDYIERGANPHAPVYFDDEVVGTAMHYCAIKGTCKGAETLKRHGATVDTLTSRADDMEGHDPLAYAIGRNRTDPHLVRFFLDNGCNADAVISREAGSLLHVAAWCGRTSICQLLLDHGKDRDDYGMRLKARLEARDMAGRTALHRAAGQGAVNTVKTLMLWGADPQARDNKGRTPLSHTFHVRKNKAVRTLLLGDTSGLNRFFTLCKAYIKR